MKSEEYRDVAGRTIKTFEGNPREWMYEFMGDPNVKQDAPKNIIEKLWIDIRPYRYRVLSKCRIIPPLASNVVYYITERDGTSRKVQFYSGKHFGFAQTTTVHDVKIISLRNLLCWNSPKPKAAFDILAVFAHAFLLHFPINELPRRLKSSVKFFIRNYVNTKF